jgi:hypothetical protein
MLQSRHDVTWAQAGSWQYLTPSFAGKVYNMDSSLENSISIVEAIDSSPHDSQQIRVVLCVWMSRIRGWTNAATPC